LLFKNLLLYKGTRAGAQHAEDDDLGDLNDLCGVLIVFRYDLNAAQCFPECPDNQGIQEIQEIQGIPRIVAELAVVDDNSPCCLKPLSALFPD